MRFASGGGLYADSGTISITQSTFDGNTSSGGHGGAGGLGGGASVVGGNGGVGGASDGADGGAVGITSASAVAVDIISSTISSNIVTGGNGGTGGGGGSAGFGNGGDGAIGGLGGDGAGGGLLYESPGALTITNSTFSGNDVFAGAGGTGGSGGTGGVTPGTGANGGDGGDTGGGGLDIGAGASPPELVHLTVTNNGATPGTAGAAGMDGDGGSTASPGNSGAETASGLAVFSTVLLDNSIVAGNANDLDVSGTFDANSGFNLIGNGDGANLMDGGNGNQVGSVLGSGVLPADLTALQDNGGPTLTHALLRGSLAIDAGDNGRIPAGVTTDQRGSGFPRVVNSTVDVGALESHGSDFGDAPDPPYPTLIASSGAEHLIVPTVFLGAGVDADPDGQPNADATGDDTDGNNDDDGVTLNSLLSPDQMASVDVVASVDGFLDAWIDFNQNGTFETPSEHINAGTPVPLSAGTNSLSFLVPSGATLGTTMARLRFTKFSGGLSPTGLAFDGEVEDYEVEIQPPTDFGDAPDPSFPTLLASDGARHEIGSGLFLGSSVDADPNGQPNATATGDDTDGNDDDDGLTLNSTLVPGQPVSFSLWASAPGFVDAWIDLDGDGTWSHPDEQFLASAPVEGGSNDFSEIIPANAAFGTTFIRLRISSTGGLLPTGLATDGEVEDHQIAIETVNRFVVNSVGDLGDNNPGDGLCDTGGLVGGNPECTLRAALEETKALPNLPAGPDVIIFDIAGGGPHTISPSSLLPAVTDPVVVDGTTEPDFSGTPVIELDGTGAGATTRGLFVSSGADGSTIRGLAINRFGSDGVLIANADGVVLEGNHIGTDPLGTAPRANARGVVLSGATNTMIGGTTANAGNTISGNSGIAILMTAGSNNNTLQDNRIGVASNGMTGLANGGTGIRIQGNSTGNTIGGATTGAGNIISGNSGHGVFVSGSGTTGNAVLGNLIGTNAAATAAIGNTQNGVFFSGAPGNTIGGTASGAGNTISGNSIGVLLIGNSTGTIVQGNAIGTNPAGAAAIPNRTGVVLSAASSATIGGSVVGAGNLISGNTGVGVLFTASSNNTLQGNLVGTAIDGTTPLANGGTGLRLQASSTNNMIGGAATGEGNTISGNGGHGVALANGGTTGNTIAGNQIGIDSGGTTAVGNAQSGVFVSSAPGNTIGGTAAGAGNTISGNSVHSILLTRTGTTNTVVAGNRIGSDATGSNPVPNLVDGIFILNAPGNTIGGAAPGAGNLITASGVHGVVVSGLVSTGNTISGNSIFGNAALGIDLDTAPADPGRTNNDVDDGDVGPNQLQNFPVITSALLGSGTLDVTFSVDSTTGNSAYDLTIEFFLADGLHGEGQTFLDSVTYASANAQLPVTETITIPGGVTVNPGDQILATATDADGNTSEFSLSRTVASPLMAEDGEASQETSDKSQELRIDELLPIVDAAIERLSAMGLDASLLASINVAIADLPGATLGLATPTSIMIDINAAGYGWFIDATPFDDSEFNAGSQLSTLDSRSRIDLLTAVMHELGHAAGLHDFHETDAEEDLMFCWLDAGARRTSLAKSLVDKAFADE